MCYDLLSLLVVLFSRPPITNFHLDTSKRVLKLKGRGDSNLTQPTIKIKFSLFFKEIDPQTPPQIKKLQRLSIFSSAWAATQ